MQTPTSSFDKTFGLGAVVPGRITTRGIAALSRAVAADRERRREDAHRFAERDGRKVLGTVRGGSRWVSRLLRTSTVSPIASLLSLAGDLAMVLSPIVPVAGAYGASVTIASFHWDHWMAVFSFFATGALLVGVALSAAVAYVLFHEAKAAIPVRVEEFRTGYRHGTPSAALQKDGQTAAICADGVYIAEPEGVRPECVFVPGERIASVELSMSDVPVLTFRFGDGRSDLVMSDPVVEGGLPLERLVGIAGSVNSADRRAARAGFRVVA